MMTQPKERSLGELFSELANETGTLVRQEVQLAKAELTAKATTAGRNIAFLAVGGAFTLAGALVLLAALVAVLDIFLPLWLAAIIVGVVVIGIGYSLIAKGLNTLKHIEPLPQKTIQTVKDTTLWAKEQIP